MMSSKGFSVVEKLLAEITTESEQLFVDVFFSMSITQHGHWKGLLALDVKE